MNTSTVSERPGLVTFRGTPVTLVGPELRVGDPAPDFTLATADLQAFTLEEAIDGGARNALFIVVPSLDTPTCSVETSTFHKRLADLPPKSAAFVVSADLPFAQRRWSQANEATGLTYLSDYRERSFGPAYGLAIKELGLLTRAIVIVGRDRLVKYVDIMAEIATEPNYDETFAELAKL